MFKETRAHGAYIAQLKNKNITDMIISAKSTSRRDVNYTLRKNGEEILNKTLTYAPLNIKTVEKDFESVLTEEEYSEIQPYLYKMMGLAEMRCGFSSKNFDEYGADVVLFVNRMPFISRVYFSNDLCPELPGVGKLRIEKEELAKIEKKKKDAKKKEVDGIKSMMNNPMMAEMFKKQKRRR